MTTNTLYSAKIPSNINPLSPNGFQFSIHKLPQLQYFCQQINLPGITLGEPEFGNPFSTIPLPGEKLTYDQLQVQFLIDENMSNYLAVHNWIVALGFPQSYDQYITFLSEDERGNLNELTKNFSDGSLTILNNLNNPVKTVNFVDMFPTTLETLIFASTNDDVQYLVGQATFRFSYYTFA